SRRGGRLPRLPPRHHRTRVRRADTMTAPIRVLVADDEKNLRELLVRELSRKGHAVEGVGDGEAALERLRDDPPDVLILDMKMPRLEGIEVLRRLAEQGGEAPQVIVTTGFQEVSSAVEAMKLGAYDYLTKPARIEELDILVRKAAEKGRLIRQNVVLRDRLDPPAPAGGHITASPKMQERPRTAWARAGRAGSGWPPPSTTTRRAPARPSWPSTAARCRARCWSPSCSATRRAPSPARCTPSPASSSSPTAARSSSTRSGRWSRRAR